MKAFRSLQARVVAIIHNYYYLHYFKQPHFKESGSERDFDGDGIPDNLDYDDDNDGIPDHLDLDDRDYDVTYEDDHDDDGVRADSSLFGDNENDSEWTDSDGDGIPDHLESSVIDAKEAILNLTTQKPTTIIIYTDIDGDGVPDEFDYDDDNDGIPDVFEVSYLGSHNGPYGEKQIDNERDVLCPRIKESLTCRKHYQCKRCIHMMFILESILVTIKVKSEMFDKFKSIQWFDINNRKKKVILQQYKKLRKIQVYFYENGIKLGKPNKKDDSELTPIRTTPFPILNLY